MIVQNGINILTGFLFRVLIDECKGYDNTVANIGTIGTSHWILPALNSSTVGTQAIDDISAKTTTAAVVAQPQLYFGTGSKAVTKDDYCLDNYVQVTSSLPIRIVNADGTAVSISQTITNSDDDTKTITELGLFIFLNTNESRVMVVRELLKTPIVLNSGDSKVVTLSINMENLSTNIS